MLFIEPVDGCIQAISPFVGQGLVFRGKLQAGAGVHIGDVFRFNSEFVPDSFRFVDHNPGKPRLEGHAVLEGPNGPEGLDKRFLHRVFGSGPIMGDHVCQPDRGLDMSLKYRFHGAAIALFNSADQLKLSFSHPLPPSSALTLYIQWASKKLIYFAD
jgi:hypothetical protein